MSEKANVLEKLIQALKYPAIVINNKKDGSGMELGKGAEQGIDDLELEGNN